MLNNKNIAIGAALGGAFLLGAIAVGFSVAQTSDNAPKSPHAKASTSPSFNAQEEEEIGEIIRSYLMENPEVIIEAVNTYSAQQRMAEVERAKTAAAANLPLLLDPTTSHIAGKNLGAAKVALIELYDYHCGYCKRAAGLIKDVVKKDSAVKVVFRELPILREESSYAAEMALAARDDEGFLDFHFEMLASSGVLTKKRIEGMARKHGLDIAKMNAAIDSGEIPSMIQGNHILAAEMGIEATPAFIVASTNGEYVEVLVGWSEERIRDMIAEAKKVAG